MQIQNEIPHVISNDVKLWLFQNNSTRHINCTCAVPSERVVYEPRLSYAQLSHFNIKRFIAGSINQQEKLKV